jgi:hypothetical protein
MLESPDISELIMGLLQSKLTAFNVVVTSHLIPLSWGTVLTEHFFYIYVIAE